MSLQETSKPNKWHSGWTAERVVELNRLKSFGFSCAEIGARMGFSRNSIIGKLYRMGFDVPNEIQDLWTNPEVETLRADWVKGLSVAEIGEDIFKKHGTQHSRRSVNSKADRLHLIKRKTSGVQTSHAMERRIEQIRSFKEPPVVPSAIDPLNIPFVQLANVHCREVTGKGNDGLALYCGHRRQEGHSYCPFHKKQNTHTINPLVRRLEWT